ncbi:MAG: glycosyltransferase family 2 protein [Rhodospirillales bacterium]|nr:glycosyltransferase family 2 protein [Rhodospirillales bacterium]
MSDIHLSALVVAHNEEAKLDDCLVRLAFADEIVVVLDKCDDGSKEIAARHTDRLLEGAWEIEGERRNTGIVFCRGSWILEIDADEWVEDALAAEIREVIDNDSPCDVFDISICNFIGGRPVRHGWMTAMGPTLKPSLFRKGNKTWGGERVHPHLSINGVKGPMLVNPVIHHIARNTSDLLRRLDRNTTWRAGDLRDRGEPGSFANMVRKMFSRFWKCYVARKGYREGGYGVVISLCSALYPVISHLKATLETGEDQAR